MSDEDDFEIEIEEGVVAVDDYLYFQGTECKYCRDLASEIAVGEVKGEYTHFPVCSRHKESVESKDKDYDYYELKNHERG